MMTRALAAFIVLLFSGEVRAETVDVKYRGPVDLKTFECRDLNRSSFMRRVCYDKKQGYLIISLGGTYYHYCELPAGTFDSLIGAPSIANTTIRISKGLVRTVLMTAERI